MIVVGWFLASATVLAQDATRYRMAFPGYTAGQEARYETALAWISWLREREYDVAGFLRRQAVVDVVLRQGDSLPRLLDAGFTIVETEISAPLNERDAQRGVPTGYVDPASLEAFLLAENAAHPTITQLMVIGQGRQGRNIYALEISNNPGVAEDKPAISFNGLHHAREVATPHVIMDIITYLTDGYAAGNPQVVNWVNQYKIYCIPMVNPDGSFHVHEVNDFHRKNMHAVCTATNPGVDLNRNYPYHWGSGAVNCERGSGSSGSTCADSYRGGAPASEPETVAMMALAAQTRPVIAVSYHSYGEFIDYPYACNDGNPDQSMPEHFIIDELMSGAADAIAAAGGPIYDVYSPIAIGPVNGDDTSWYYAHNGTYALIIEMGTSFQPSFAVGMQQVAHNRAGWLYLLERLGEARLDVRAADHLTGDPLAARVELLDFVMDTGEWPRTSDAVFGRSRWMVPGFDTYTVRVSASGYQSRQINVGVAGSPVDQLALLLPTGAVLGDHEPDGDVDMSDYLWYQACLGQSPVPNECRILDFSADEQLNLSDWPAFAAALAGP
jgi:hypothetical protein